jgi:hypothetical protein
MCERISVARKLQFVLKRYEELRVEKPLGDFRELQFVKTFRKLGICLTGGIIFSLETPLAQSLLNDETEHKGNKVNRVKLLDYGERKLWGRRPLTLKTTVLFRGNGVPLFG